MNVYEKIEHLKSLGMSGDFSEIENLYWGLPFKVKDENIQNLITLSKSLCNKYNSTLKELNSCTDATKKESLKLEASKLLDAIFPGHGMFAGVNDGLYATIGMVDCKDFVFINKNITFAPFTLVTCGRFALFGPFQNIGSIEKVSNGISPVGNIVVEGDNWICAGCTIENNTHISKKTLIGLGSIIKSGSNIESGYFAYGNPCEEKIKIDKYYASSNIPQPKRSDDEINFIINHIKSLGIDGDFTEYKRILNGEEYNCFDPVIAKVIDLSHNLSYEFSNYATTQERKEEILHILFPIQKANFKVSGELFVDILGLINIGENVTIENNNYLAGNITIGDNVIIGENNCIAGIGHRVYYAGRRLQKFHNGFGEICTIGHINIGNNVELSNCIVSPNSNVTTSMENKNILRNKIFDRIQNENTTTYKQESSETNTNNFEQEL